MPRIADGLHRKLLPYALLLCAAVFLALHFLHLRADFPNHSPWVDWAKYTDEGWYGDAAIRHYLRGTWRLPGDFNPAVALPVWPLLEALVFRFTGVGIVAARALTLVVFAGILTCSYVLLSLPSGPQQDARTRRIFAAAAVLLLTASSFIYAFTRIAILEPLLILWLLLALCAAYGVRLAKTPIALVGYSITVGMLIVLMIGTKTTALFLLPAVCFMLWSSAKWQLRRMIQVSAIAGLTVVVLCGIYVAVLLHAGLQRDFIYLFAANGYTAITRSTFVEVITATLQDGLWIGSLIYPLAMLVLLAAVFRPRVWRDAVFTSLALSAVGYMAFMAYHANLQPRYYLVVAVPLILLLLRGTLHLAQWNALSLYAAVPLFGIVLLGEMRNTLHYIRHPEYSFLQAAEHIEQVVESDPEHSHTVLSISGSNLSLMTGLPSICDDFGTMQLEDRIAAYKPGWFVTWNVVEDDKMQALSRFYRLTRVAEFPAMDDPDRNVMIVYRLDANEGVKPKRKRPGARALPTIYEVPSPRSQLPPGAADQE